MVATPFNEVDIDTQLVVRAKRNTGKGNPIIPFFFKDVEEIQFPPCPVAYGMRVTKTAKYEGTNCGLTLKMPFAKCDLTGATEEFKKQHAFRLWVDKLFEAIVSKIFNNDKIKNDVFGEGDIKTTDIKIMRSTFTPLIKDPTDKRSNTVPILSLKIRHSLLPGKPEPAKTAESVPPENYEYKVSIFTVTRDPVTKKGKPVPVDHTVVPKWQAITEGMLATSTFKASGYIAIVQGVLNIVLDCGPNIMIKGGSVGNVKSLAIDDSLLSDEEETGGNDEDDDDYQNDSPTSAAAAAAAASNGSNVNVTIIPPPPSAGTADADPSAGAGAAGAATEYDMSGVVDDTDTDNADSRQAGQKGQQPKQRQQQQQGQQQKRPREDATGGHHADDDFGLAAGSGSGSGTSTGSGSAGPKPLPFPLKTAPAKK